MLMSRSGVRHSHSDLEGSPNPRGIFVMAAARGSICWRSHTPSSADEQAEAGGQVEAEGSKGGCSCPQPAPAMQERQLAQPRVPCLACHLHWVPSRPCCGAKCDLGVVSQLGRVGCKTPGEWAGPFRYPQQWYRCSCGPAQGDLLGHLL